MASIIDRIKNDLLEAINASQRKTSAYDTEAEVVRIEGNTAWVHIGGGVPETPVQLTINAQKGDKVQVRVSNEGAWIMGNATAPPTDDTKAEEAKQEIVDTNIIVKAVKTIADRAVKIAGNTNQYFWHTQEGTDTGAHITEIPQEEFLEDPANGGGNLLARSNGIAVRDGLAELAQFGATVARIGQEGDANIKIRNSEIEGVGKDGAPFFFFSGDGNTLISTVLILEESIPYNSIPTSLQTAKEYVETLSDHFMFWVKFGSTASGFRQFHFYYGTAETKASTHDGISFTIIYDGDSTIKFYCDSKISSWDYIITRIYNYVSRPTPVFILGEDNDATGGFGYAEGSNNTVQGDYSHAEGYGNLVNQMYSHVEGYKNEAGTSSTPTNLAWGLHVEGRGNVAIGSAAHAEGLNTYANGNCSHAQNNGTIARSYQTAIGKYNIQDSNGVYLFIAGNGAAGARSNALTVDWSGNTAIAGTLTQGSDRRLKDHISYLGEDAVDFIRQLKPAHYRKNDADHVGFYAQDVESADKWNCMVGEMNGFKTLGYTELIAPLVAYCQSLEKRIEELEGE